MAKLNLIYPKVRVVQSKHLYKWIAPLLIPYQRRVQLLTTQRFDVRLMQFNAQHPYDFCDCVYDNVTDLVYCVSPKLQLLHNARFLALTSATQHRTTVEKIVKSLRLPPFHMKQIW